jgi:hypothetical protein
MPLNWTTAEGSPARETATNAADGVVFGICMALMITGVSKITVDNAGVVIARIRLMERLHGPIFRGRDEDGKPITGVTVNFVLSFVGLRVNVADETEAKFLRRVTGNTLKDLVQQARSEVAEVTAAVA